jgi:hypothetical protein
MLVAVAVLAAVFVSTFSIDLGRFPQLKRLAEQYASRRLERPFHIGGLSAELATGKFVLTDVEIEGPPGERPFFTARTIKVGMPWGALFGKELVVEVRMSHWTMLIEQWPGRNNMPRFASRNPSTGPSMLTKTARFVYGDHGTFTLDDHTAPWSVVAPNVDFRLVRATYLGPYVGTASFNQGTVQIQNFLPMRAAVTTRFSLDGSVVTLRHMDLLTDGAVSHINGIVDFSKGPEQTYNVSSEVDFARMRELFFSNETWRVSGQGHFAGIFHLFKGGRDLTGDFTSERATVNGADFTNLHGSLVWLPNRFAVTHADADFYGGGTRFTYAIAPIGTPIGATQTFAADYDRVDLGALFTRLFDVKALPVEGQARGHLDLAWPSGRLHTGLQGRGETVVTAPTGVTLAAAALPAVVPIVGPEPGQFDPRRPLARLPVGGTLAYQIDADGLTFDESTIATPSTHIAFHGRRLHDGQATLSFHATSTDVQASDRLFTAIMEASGQPTDAVDVGGYGTFDGAMTGSFASPRIEGNFAGDAMRAWRVDSWGSAKGHVVIQNRYLDLTDGVIARGPGVIRANGRFSLGYPRKDHGEEMNARVSLTRWPLADLKAAFELTDWPVDATVGAVDVQLHGPYKGLFGGGKMRLDDGVAWRESFKTATGDLTLDGTGMQIDNLQMTKGPDLGSMAGSAYINWASTYWFKATGTKIPVESLDNFKIPRAPLSGVLAFTASGEGAFASPSYRVHAEVPDLSAGDEGIGAANADLKVDGDTLTIEQLEVNSTRLHLRGHGQLTMNDLYDAKNLEFSFQNSSLDPYLKFVKFPERMSPPPRAVIGGSVRMQGPLRDYTRWSVDARLDAASLSLWEYELQNDGQLHLTFEDNVVKIERFALTGRDTKLELTGSVSVADAQINVTAKGEANLEILKSPNLTTASGTATISAEIKGPIKDPTFAGTADLVNGSLRYIAMPQRITDLHGQVVFDARRIDASGLRARMGDGDVMFGGYVTLKEYYPDEFNLTATGRGMRLRYPKGFSSLVDVPNLALTGPVSSPTLSGNVTVISAAYGRQIGTDVLSLAAAAAAGGTTAVQGEAAPVETGYPLQYNIHIHAEPSTLVIDNKPLALIEGGGDLTVSGTFDRPVLLGQLDITRGDINWNGNHYVIRAGSIEFSDPQKIDPYFTVEGEVHPRAPGQTYVVTIGAAGTLGNLKPTIASDPWLSDYDIVRLLLGEAPNVGSAEQAALRSPQEQQAKMIQALTAQMIASPISSRVGSVFGHVTGAPSVVITPNLGSETMRVILGQQINSKAFLTYMRTLNSSQSDVILLEYEQSDRFSWILSRNEDRTLALDFRIRYVF